MHLIHQLKNIARKPADHPIGYLVAISGAMMQIMCYGIDNSFSVFSDSMQKDASLGFPSATMVSFGNSVALGLTPAFGVLAGFIVDRVPSRVLMFTSTILLFAGLWISSSYAHSSIAVTFSYCLLASLACACMLSPGPAVTSTWFKSKLGLAQGITFCGGGIGSAFIPAVLGQWVGQYGWRKTFRYASCFCAIGLVASILSCKREEPDSDDEADNKRDVADGDDDNIDAHKNKIYDTVTSHDDVSEVKGEVHHAVKKAKNLTNNKKKKKSKSSSKLPKVNQHNEEQNQSAFTGDAMNAQPHMSSLEADITECNELENEQRLCTNTTDDTSAVVVVSDAQTSNGHNAKGHEPVSDNGNVFYTVLPPSLGTEPPNSDPSFSGFDDTTDNDEDDQDDDNTDNESEEHNHIHCKSNSFQADHHSKSVHNTEHEMTFESTTADKLANMTAHERLIHAMHTRKLTALELIRVYMTCDFLANFFMMLIFGWAFYGLIYVTVPYVSSMGKADTVYAQVHPIPTSKASTVFTFWGAFQVVGSVLMGGLASFTVDEFAYCSCSFIGTIACIAFIFCRNYVGFAFTLSIIGFCTAGMFAVMLALITKPMYGPNLGALMSCVFVAASVGGFSAPPIQAHLQTTHHGDYTYGCIFITLSMAVPGLICFFLLWKDKKDFLPLMSRRYLHWRHKTAAGNDEENSSNNDNREAEMTRDANSSKIEV